jgi:hypothetical protein
MALAGRRIESKAKTNTNWEDFRTKRLDPTQKKKGASPKGLLLCTALPIKRFILPLQPAL